MAHPGAVTDTQLQRGPIAAYSFDEGEGKVAGDNAGEHNGDLVNTEWVKGKYGSAIYLDGNSDYVEIPDSPELQLEEEFTLESWVRPEGVEDEGAVISKTAGGFYSYQLYAGSREAAGIPEGFLGYEAWAWEDVEDETPLQAKTWNHLALTFDGANLRLYVNGELVDTESSLPAMASVGSLYLGGNEDEEDFKGRIDEVRIYDRALDAGELAADQATPIETPPSAPVAAYSFDEGEGGTVADLTGHGHTATIEGAQWTTKGRYGGAMEFDVADQEDVLKVPDADDLDLTEDFTLEAWVRPLTAPRLGDGDREGRRRRIDFSYLLYSQARIRRPRRSARTGQKPFREKFAEEPSAEQAWSHLALT